MSNWSVKQQLREDILEAVETGDRQRVEKLIDQGANVNESVGAYLSGKTLLFLSIEKGYTDIAQLLVDRGADITSTININKSEKTPAELARDKENETLAEYIERRRNLDERLRFAVKSDDVAGAQAVIQEGANVNILDKNESNETNLLVIALLNRQTQIAKLLIESNIDLHYVVKWADENEETARSLAQRQDMAEIVSLIDSMATRRLNTSHETHSSSNGKLITNGLQNEKEDGMVLDIEDEEFEYNAEVKKKVGAKHRRVSVNRKNKKSPACAVS